MSFTTLKKHYNSSMRIVLPGALPDPAQARELIPHVEQQAPSLVKWLRAARATVTPADPNHTGCTPVEYWQLCALGFTPGSGQNFATGLGPFLYGLPDCPPSEPVWLVELVHVSPARDGAALLPAGSLDISAEQNQALLQSVSATFAAHGFTVQAAGEHHWRVTLPTDCQPFVVSPTLVSQTSVNAWWSQAPESRAWRRLVNEVQMLWFDHPVNSERYTQQRVPVNSLWLFGGASAAQFKQKTLENTRIIPVLAEPALHQDWGLWLQELGTLNTLFESPLTELVLTGNDRIITLCPAPLERLKNLLALSTNAWRTWWSPRN